MSRLSPAIVRLLLGTVVNSFGNGLVYPYVLIYLHEVRGFSLSTGGALIALMAVTGIAVTPFVGTQVDRVGAHRLTAAAVCALFIGFGLFPFAHRLPFVIVLALVIGVGQGAWWPAQSSLLSVLTTHHDRPFVLSLQRAAMNLGMGSGGIVGGLIAVSSRPSTYRGLFLLNAATFMLFLLLLAGVAPPVRSAVSPADRSTGYAFVLRDRFFMRLLVLDLAIGACFAFAFDVLPAHATGDLGLSNRTVGLLFLTNTTAIVLLQMPAARLVQGRRRMRGYGLMGMLFAAGFLGVVGARSTGSTVFVLALAMLLFGIAECFLGPVRGALTAELAPEGSIGRYSALAAGAFQVGMAGGRALGGVMLDLSAAGLWWIAAGVAVGSTVLALRSERRMPPNTRLGPGERFAGVGASRRAGKHSRSISA